MTRGPGLSPAVLARLSLVFALPALVLAVAVAIHPAPLPGDAWFAKLVQRSTTLEANAWLINLAGEGTWRLVPLAIAAALASAGWRLGGGAGGPVRYRAEAVVAFVLAAILPFFNNRVKGLVESPRPSAGAGIRIDGEFSYYGFPSGHVVSSVVVYGALAALAPVWVHPRAVLPVRALCLALIVLSGPARIAVGAHWPSDTLGGYLLGGAALFAVLALARLSGRLFRTH